MIFYFINPLPINGPYKSTEKNFHSSFLSLKTTAVGDDAVFAHELFMRVFHFHFLLYCCNTHK